RAPTAVMVASSMRTTPSGLTATSGDGITRPPTSAVTRPPAAVAGGGAVPHTAGSTAAVASAAAPRESRRRWSKRVIIEARFSPDQRRQINDLPAAEVLAKDRCRNSDRNSDDAQSHAVVSLGRIQAGGEAMRLEDVRQ